MLTVVAYTAVAYTPKPNLNPYLGAPPAGALPLGNGTIDQLETELKRSQDCSDTPPPSDWKLTTCKDQREHGMCGERAAAGDYCQKTCGVCTDAAAGATPELP